MYRVSSKSIDFSISSLIQSFLSRQNAENEQKMTWLVSSTWSVRVIFKSITRKIFTKIRATIKSDPVMPKFRTEMMKWSLIDKSRKIFQKPAVTKRVSWKIFRKTSGVVPQKFANRGFTRNCQYWKRQEHDSKSSDGQFWLFLQYQHCLPLWFYSYQRVNHVEISVLCNTYR